MSIREIRELSGMTQQAFGDYFGVPLRTIQNWEGGQRKCPDYLLDLIEYKLRKENIIKHKPETEKLINGEAVFEQTITGLKIAVPKRRIEE